MHTILLIDDDERLAKLLEEYFSRYDLNLISETHPYKGIEQVENNHDIELIILDVMLPDMDGFEVCKNIRKFSEIPIVMLTARGEVMDRVVGLEIGADDYVSKPFESRELVARIYNIFKRINKHNSNTKTTIKAELQNNTIQLGPLVLDKANYTASVNHIKLDLTHKEYELLHLLVDKPDKIFNRDEIMNLLSGIDADFFSRSIDILVSRLRQKLQPLNCIQTVWGKGYRFISPEKLK